MERSLPWSVVAHGGNREHPRQANRTHSETCEMMGARDKFDRTLPDLETYLEGEIAAGEISETRLTFGHIFSTACIFSSSGFSPLIAPAVLYKNRLSEDDLCHWTALLLAAARPD
jgi:hypothetical protein